MSCSRDAEHCEQIARAHGVPESVAVWAVGRGAGGHCERCGGFLTAEGVCNNPRCLTREHIISHLRTLPTIERGYRVPAYFPYRGTATAIIDFERDELGNDNGISSIVYEALRRGGVSAQSVVWVTKAPEEAAERYGEGDMGAVVSIDMPPGSVVIGEDGDAGYLVWKGALSVADSLAMARRSILSVVGDTGDTEASDNGVCPQCGAGLSVGEGAQDWCVNCMDLVTARRTRASAEDEFEEFMRISLLRYRGARIPDSIKERWHNRVVRNNWQYSKEGAEAYLRKYGKNIGSTKVTLLAIYAESLGYKSFAYGMWQKLYRMTH